MSLLETQRATYRKRRERPARKAMDKLLGECAQLQQSAQGHAKDDLTALAADVLQLKHKLAELQFKITAANIESLREQARVTFKLPVVPTANGPAVWRPSIVYCDPPWHYDHKAHVQTTNAQYDTMSDEAICALPVAGLATEDAALLMWATLPKLHSALHVMESWGFEFRAVYLIWVKQSRFYGRAPPSQCAYTKAQAEILLLGTRGTMYSAAARTPDVHSNVLLSRVDNHSHKPDIVRRIIVEMFGDLPRMELFARPNADDFGQRDDWRLWGNEVDATDTPAAEGDKYVAKQVVARTKKRTGNSIKRDLAKKLLKDSTPRGNPDARPPACTVNELEHLHDQYCEFAHNDAEWISAADVEDVTEQEAKRARFLEMLDSPAVDSGDQLPLSECLSKADLEHNQTLEVHATNLRHPIYVDSTVAEVREKVEIILRKQCENADRLFAFTQQIQLPSN